MSQLPHTWGVLSELEEPIPDPMPPCLAAEVLVVGADDWAIRRATAELTGAGRRVHRCHDSAETPFPCNALIPGRGCPLDSHHVDVVIDVRARAHAEPSMGEMGAICGLRAGLPLVLAGLSEAALLEHWAATVPADGDIVTTCDEAMRDHAAAETAAGEGGTVVLDARTVKAARL